MFPILADVGKLDLFGFGNIQYLTLVKIHVLGSSPASGLSV